MKQDSISQQFIQQRVIEIIESIVKSDRECIIDKLSEQYSLLKSEYNFLLNKNEFQQEQDSNYQRFELENDRVLQDMQIYLEENNFLKNEVERLQLEVANPIQLNSYQQLNQELTYTVTQLEKQLINLQQETEQNKKMNAQSIIEFKDNVKIKLNLSISNMSHICFTKFHQLQDKVQLKIEMLQNKEDNIQKQLFTLKQKFLQTTLSKWKEEENNYVQKEELQNQFNNELQRRLEQLEIEFSSQLAEQIMQVNNLTDELKTITLENKELNSNFSEMQNQGEIKDALLREAQLEIETMKERLQYYKEMQSKDEQLQHLVTNSKQMATNLNQKILEKHLQLENCEKKVQELELQLSVKFSKGDEIALLRQKLDLAEKDLQKWLEKYEECQQQIKQSYELYSQISNDYENQKYQLDQNAKDKQQLIADQQKKADQIVAEYKILENEFMMQQDMNQKLSVANKDFIQKLEQKQKTIEQLSLCAQQQDDVIKQLYQQIQNIQSTEQISNSKHLNLKKVCEEVNSLKCSYESFKRDSQQLLLEYQQKIENFSQILIENFNHFITSNNLKVENEKIRYRNALGEEFEEKLRRSVSIEKQTQIDQLNEINLLREENSQLMSVIEKTENQMREITQQLKMLATENEDLKGQLIRESDFQKILEDAQCQLQEKDRQIIKLKNSEKKKIEKFQKSLNQLKESFNGITQTSESQIKQIKQMYQDENSQAKLEISHLKNQLQVSTCYSEQLIMKLQNAEAEIQRLQMQVLDQKDNQFNVSRSQKNQRKFDLLQEEYCRLQNDFHQSQQNNEMKQKELDELNLIIEAREEDLQTLLNINENLKQQCQESFSQYEERIGDLEQEKNELVRLNKKQNLLYQCESQRQQCDRSSYTIADTSTDVQHQKNGKLQHQLQQLKEINSVLSHSSLRPNNNKPSPISQRGNTTSYLRSPKYFNE